MNRTNNASKLRREKAPKEGYNRFRLLENFTLRELQFYTLRQLYDPVERPDVERRETP